VCSSDLAQDPINEYLANQPAAQPHQEGPETGPFPEPSSPVTAVMPPPSWNQKPANEAEGIDPEHGDNVAGCKVWASWGTSWTTDYIGIYGHFSCSHEVVGFEIQIALQLVVSGGVTGGQYEQVGGDTHDFHSTSGGETEAGWSCQFGDDYRAWVWGRYWNAKGETIWYSTELDGRLESCGGPDVAGP